MMTKCAKIVWVSDILKNCQIYGMQFFQILLSEILGADDRIRLSRSVRMMKTVGGTGLGHQPPCTRPQRSNGNGNMVDDAL